MEEVVRRFEMVRRPLCDRLMGVEQRERGGGGGGGVGGCGGVGEGCDEGDGGGGAEEEEEEEENVLMDKEKLKDTDTAAAYSGKRRAPMSSVHYGGMKKRKLQQLCAQYNLSTKGSERELKTRHGKFVTLYNAECAATHPHTMEELASEVMQRENNAKKVSSVDQRNGTYKQNKDMQNLWEARKRAGKGEDVLVRSGNEKFDALIKNNFSDMIRALKEQKRKVNKKKEMEGCNDENRNDEMGTNIKGVDTPHNEPSKKASSGESPNTQKLSMEAETVNVSSCKNNSQGQNNNQDRFVSLSGIAHEAIKINDKTTSPESESLQDTDEFKAPSSLGGSCTSKEYLATPNTSFDVKKWIDDQFVQDIDDETPRCKKDVSSLQNEFPSVTHSISYSNEKPTKQDNFSPSLIGAWDCPACTYKNEKRTFSFARCEICNTKRPSVESSTIQRRTRSRSKVEEIVFIE